MNIKKAVIPFSCFDDIKQDIARFSRRDDLNRYQKWIISEGYVLDPLPDFTPRSIISAAVRFELWNSAFMYQGKRYVCETDKAVSDKDVLQCLSSQNQYQFFYHFWLPQKRIAVRSGLADYGRNNICYIDGFGSLFTLFTFISDMPAPPDYTWREVVCMQECENCTLCQSNCPTGAILPGRFLIDNQKCLSSVNEWGTDPFPESIPQTAHHRVIDCSRCQEICPQNRGLYQDIRQVIEFSEDETGLLVSGAEFDTLPADMAAKVELCGMKGYYPSLPRNLRAWFASGN